MNKKIALGVVAVVVVTIVGYMATRTTQAPVKEETTNMDNQAVSTSTTSMPNIEQMSALQGTANYSLDPDSTTFKWQGRRPLMSGYMDNGFVKIKEGSAEMKDGKLTGGSVTIDLTSIGVDSTGSGKGESMLAGHLKSDAFFDVEKYPTSSFTITSATQDATDAKKYTVKGNLTIKDKTNEIEFPATLVDDGKGGAYLSAKFDIDRTKWDVRYGSGKFFSDIGDKMIDDNFTVEFTVHGTKK